MKRREVLRYSGSSILGLSILPSLTTFLHSCGVGRITDYKPQYLSPEQFDTIWQLAELILPKTDSPGASDAGVAPYIDLLFHSYFKESDRSRLEEQINAFMSNCEVSTGKRFTELAETRQVQFLKEQEAAGKPFFATFKRLTLWAFFTSEPGMKSMNYQPNPGQYDGCTTIDENEKLMVGNQGPRGYFNQ